MAARFTLRPLLTVVGLLAAAGLVWYVGPLLAVAGHAPLADERVRMAAVAGLVALAVLHALWRMARGARRNRRLMEGLIAPGPGEREVAVLGERFEQAVQLLRRGRVGGWHPVVGAFLGRPYVYQLPWYVIVGAPGAGKTTALVNSGLRFPLAEAVGDRVVRGVGGTRHCDWWFTDEAVLIDTAGRYTTHDSDRAADRTAWLGFLDLLRRYRPRRPINGVLLTVSVSDLLGAPHDARLAHAAAVRARIDELHERLGMRLPIYVLVTKTDLLAGFMEFFADFDKDERAQVWGFTFAHGPQAAQTDALAQMAGEFASLEKRLHDFMLERLHAEADRERRAAIHAFPQQWRVLRDALADFLNAAFGATAPAGPATPGRAAGVLGARADATAAARGADGGSGAPGGPRPFLRGVYFTSATQEGTPMDRALGALARSMGLATRVVPPARPSGKSFFVTRLLRDVVFAEAGLAGTDLRWERRRVALQWAAVGASAAAVAGVSVLAGLAYQDGRAAVAAVGDRLPDLQRGVELARRAGPTELAAMVPVLDALQALSAPGEGRRVPVLDRREMLAAAAGDAYRRTLKEAFLPRIAARLEARMRSAGEEHVGLLYEALRAYLMLFAGRNFDRAALRGYLAADWDATLPPTVDAGQRAALRRHLDTLLAGDEVGAPAQADPRLVARAREVVAGVPLAERVYRRLLQAEAGPEFSVESAVGAAARGVFVRASGQPLGEGIPALYTRAVTPAALRERADAVLRQFETEQAWVLGAPLGSEIPASEVVDDVERRYLEDHARLWGDFVADLRLVTPATVGQAAGIAQALARPDSPLLALLRAIVREASAAAPAGGADGEDAQPAFDVLRRYVVGQPAPIDEAQRLLGALASHLVTVDDAVRRKAVPPTNGAPRAVAIAARSAPEPVRSMLAQLASDSAAHVFGVLREPLARRLAGEVAPACARSVGGRYPLVRASREETDREDFVRTFGPKGLLDSFFERNLLPYVDTSARPWSFHGTDRAQAGESLAQFQRVRAIQEAFFDAGRLDLQLELRLLELGPGMGEFALEVDGLPPVRFRRGAKAAQTLPWPGPGSGHVKLQAGPPGGAGTSYVFEGPWALLRLLDRVRVEPGPRPGRLTLVFDVEGRKARFETPGAGPAGPALRAELERFQCPKRL